MTVTHGYLSASTVTAVTSLPPRRPHLSDLVWVAAPWQQLCTYPQCLLSAAQIQALTMGTATILILIANTCLCPRPQLEYGSSVILPGGRFTFHLSLKKSSGVTIYVRGRWGADGGRWGADEGSCSSVPLWLCRMAVAERWLMAGWWIFYFLSFFWSCFKFRAGLSFLQEQQIP